LAGGTVVAMRLHNIFYDRKANGSWLGFKDANDNDYFSLKFYKY